MTRHDNSPPWPQIAIAAPSNTHARPALENALLQACHELTTRATEACHLTWCARFAAPARQNEARGDTHIRHACHGKSTLRARFPRQSHIPDTSLPNETRVRLNNVKAMPSQTRSCPQTPQKQEPFATHSERTRRLEPHASPQMPRERHPVPPKRRFLTPATQIHQSQRLGNQPYIWSPAPATRNAHQRSLRIHFPHDSPLLPPETHIIHPPTRQRYRDSPRILRETPTPPIHADTLTSTSQ